MTNEEVDRKSPEYRDWFIKKVIYAQSVLTEAITVNKIKRSEGVSALISMLLSEMMILKISPESMARVKDAFEAAMAELDANFMGTVYLKDFEK